MWCKQAQHKVPRCQMVHTRKGTETLVPSSHKIQACSKTNLRFLISVSFSPCLSRCSNLTRWVFKKNESYIPIKGYLGLFQGLLLGVAQVRNLCQHQNNIDPLSPRTQQLGPCPGTRTWPFHRSTANRILRRSVGVGCANISSPCAAARSSITHPLVKLRYCFTSQYCLRAHRNLWQMATLHFFSVLNMKSICLLLLQA